MTESFDIFVSILLGFGISAIFKMCCDSRSCMMYRAPLLDQEFIRYENKCYKPTERPETCDATKTLVMTNE